ncbi:MAG: 5-formyltetrahydrofolate cyclo-ligase [Tannerella sp.]|nr:5-formyltetrahydrofolate cyclo-ligase [Tannerella sp.]
MDNGTAKRQLRREVSLWKKHYQDETLQEFSAKIHARIERSPLFRDAARITCYHALPGEVQTSAFLEKWYGRKQIFLPAVDGEQLKFYPYRGKNNLKTGAFGIMEPAADEETSTCNIDLAIIPGIAFDRRLNRLGRGKGFYDRFLAPFCKPVMGLCFHFQLVDAVPVDEHDRKMTQIITERETIG